MGAGIQTVYNNHSSSLTLLFCPVFPDYFSISFYIGGGGTGEKRAARKSQCALAL